MSQVWFNFVLWRRGKRKMNRWGTSKSLLCVSHSSFFDCRHFCTCNLASLTFVGSRLQCQASQREIRGLRRVTPVSPDFDLSLRTGIQGLKLATCVCLRGSSAWVSLILYSNRLSLFDLSLNSYWLKWPGYVDSESKLKSVASSKYTTTRGERNISPSFVSRGLGLERPIVVDWQCSVVWGFVKVSPAYPSQ